MCRYSMYLSVCVWLTPNSLKRTVQESTSQQRNYEGKAAKAKHILYVLDFELSDQQTNYLIRSMTN